MGIILIAIFVVVLTILYGFYKNATYWKYFKNFPGPPTSPIIGNIHMLGADSVEYNNNLLRWWKEAGCDNYLVWIGFKPILVLSNPKDVETILASNTLIDKGDTYKLLHDWLGDGLLTATGKKWHKHRKMITPSFHFSILVEFFDIMNRVSDKFINKLKDKAENGSPFDIQDLVHYATLDIICVLVTKLFGKIAVLSNQIEIFLETAMGTNINAMDNPGSEIVSSYQDMCFTTNERSFGLIRRFDFLYQFTSHCKRRMRSLNLLKKFISEVIEKRKKILDGENKVNGTQNDDEYKPKPKKAFLDNLLTAKIDNRPLTFQEVFEEVQTFLFEGHDTTTSGISFVIYLLAKHPEVQQKVFEEQKEILGDLSQNPTFQQALDMKYLELVIKESQRLFPSVPLIVRETGENIMIGGRHVPAKTSVTIFIMAMGYNEKYFPEPNKFNPDRFNPANYDKKNPFEYVPFSAGPRNCIGQKFALQELKCILSKIVRNFEILPANEKVSKYDGYNWDQKDGEDELKLASALTLKANEGIYIKLKKRSV